MLTHEVYDEPGSAQKYFLSGLSRADYFIEGHEIPGVWQGQGAAKLGLKGAVEREHFDALCENIHPHLGVKLTPRNKVGRRIMYDLCISIPKSASIRYGLVGDVAILEAAREACRHMMSVLESEFAGTRVRKGGVSEDRLSRNLVWAEFTHLTTRPVNGVPDPHVHTHNAVFNMTHDGVEDRWKAAQMRGVIEACPFLEALFLSEMAARLEQRGYPIQKIAKGWELAGYSRPLIEKFSNRTDEINAANERKGIRSKWLKSKQGASTRKAKDKSLKLDELRNAWSERLTDAERETVFENVRAPVQPRTPKLLAEAIKHVINTCFERSALVRETTLLAEALLYQPGNLRLEEIREEMARQGVVLRKFGGKTFATTKAIAKEEQKMLELVKSGRGRFSPFLDGKLNGVFGLDRLTPEETRIAEFILKSRDLVTIVRATPETDMRKVMSVVSRVSRQKLWRGVTRVAPNAAVARESHGWFGRKRAHTVSAMLGKMRLRFRARRSFVWMEDAGRVGTQEMTKVLNASTFWRFRMVLTSYSRTEHGPTRGDPLHIIASHTNTSTLRVQHPSRSKGQHRQVLSQMYEGNGASAMRLLNDLERLREFSRPNAIEEMAKESVAVLKNGRTALVVAADNQEKDYLNSRIRRLWLEAQRMWHKGWKFSTLKSLNLSLAQRKDPKSYRRGQVVKFFKAAPLFKNGTKWKVMGHDFRGRVIIRNGVRFEALPLWMANRFQVYERVELKLRAGDKIRITENGEAKGHGRDGRTSPLDWIGGTFSRELHAGTLHEVSGLSLKGDLVLEKGLTVPRSFEFFEYGYSVTANSGYRPRVDRVILGAFDPSSKGFDVDNMAGRMSKAKLSATVYTNEKEVLLNAERRNGNRQVALDVHEPESKRWSKATFEPPRDRGRDWERERERERIMER